MTILNHTKYGQGNLISELNGRALVDFNGTQKDLIIQFAKMTKEDGTLFVATVFEEEPKEEKKTRKTRKPLKEKFITKADLKEYKKLIIWLLNNKVNYQGCLNLKESMGAILAKAENNEICYKTKRGIKGAITRATIELGLANVEENLRKQNGFNIKTLTNGNSILEHFQNHRLNVLS